MRYVASLKTARMQLAADAIAGGSLVIGDATLSGSTGVLSTISLGTPAATVSGAVLTISGVPISGSASATGTPALAELRNSSGTTIVDQLTVGTSGTNIIVTAASFISGGAAIVTSGTITHG